MIISHEQEILAATINSSEVRNAAMKVLIGEKEGWTDHVMRLIELGPEGYSPKHKHPWPHINYMVEGSGTLYVDGKETAVDAGAFAFVPAHAEHQFRNAGGGKFRFICIVPKQGHQ